MNYSGEAQFVHAVYLKSNGSRGYLQEFEDLDEITARYVQPMAAFARDLLGHKYFHDCNGGDRKVCYNSEELPFFCSLHLDIYYEMASANCR